MRLDIKGDKLFLKNDYAGCMWLFYTFLFLPFVVGIYLLWQEPRETAPLYFVLPFTLVFLATAPILIWQAMKMRIVTVEIDRTLGTAKITKSAIFSKTYDSRKLDEINAIHVECSDNDGEFFNVTLRFKDDDELPIIHGSSRTGVYDEITRIAEFLSVRYSGIPVTETRV